MQLTLFISSDHKKIHDNWRGLRNKKGFDGRRMEKRGDNGNMLKNTFESYLKKMRTQGSLVWKGPNWEDLGKSLNILTIQ